MKNIHILSTDKPSRLHNKNGQLGHKATILYIEDFIGNKHNSFNIYITSDEEIKDGDYYLYLKDNSVQQFIKRHHTKLLALDIQKKIILTTDQDLIKDGVQEIPDDFLEWFVKNPSCEEVEIISLEKRIGSYDGKGSVPIYVNIYGLIIPKEEPKPFKDMLSMTEASLAEFKKNPIPAKREWREPFVNTMPMIRVEPKQETIEEAAERAVKSGLFKDETLFIAGTKWQQEQNDLRLKHIEALLSNCEKTLEKKIKQEISYSEKEIKSAFKIGFSIGYGSPVNGLDSKDETCDVWFDQLKRSKMLTEVAQRAMNEIWNEAFPEPNPKEIRVMSKEIELELTIGGTDITVSGYYSPDEDAIMYDSNMEGYPGCAAEFELQSVQVNGTEIIDLISDAIFDEIVNKVLENQH